MTPEEKSSQSPDVFSQFARIQPTMVSLRRMFLLLTRAHFSDNAHYGGFKDQLAKYVWHRETRQSGLWIDFDYHLDAKKLEQRPAIFVGTDDITYKQVVTDNRKGTTADNSGKEFVTVGNTTVILRHISSTPDDALTLCELSTQFYLGIRPLMQERVGFRSYHVAAQKSSRPFDRAPQQADQQFTADLIIALEFNAIWLAVEESHRIKTISFSASQTEFRTAETV